MERIDGIPIDDLHSLRESDHDPVRLVESITQMLAEGILDVGLFHADPHPENFAVVRDCSLVVPDFGLVGSIDERLRERLLLLPTACAKRDSSRIVDEVTQLGAVHPG